MAVIYYKEPSAFYPGYNDSWVLFSSNVSGRERAEITVEGTTFLLFPDAGGDFAFNLKTIVQKKLNENGFSDEVEPGENEIFTQFGSILYYQITVNFKVYHVDGFDNGSRLYTFYKSVVQKGQFVNTNNIGLAHSSENDYDYYLTYFPGFPFFFEIKRTFTDTFGDFVVENDYTGIKSKPVFVTANRTPRFYIDKGEGSNWDSENFMPLMNLKNDLQLTIGGKLAANLHLKKKPKKCGAYLKWFNSNGSFSFWLFDYSYFEDVSTREIDKVSTNGFYNVGETGVNRKSFGRSGENSISLKTRADANEMKHLKDLFISPNVQYYTSNNPEMLGVFIDVSISGRYTYNPNKKFNEVSLSVELPEIETITY